MRWEGWRRDGFQSLRFQDAEQAAEKPSFGQAAATLRRHNLNRCNAQMAG